jgi:hypothetical protein
MAFSKSSVPLVLVLLMAAHKAAHGLQAEQTSASASTHTSEALLGADDESFGTQVGDMVLSMELALRELITGVEDNDINSDEGSRRSMQSSRSSRSRRVSSNMDVGPSVRRSGASAPPPPTTTKKDNPWLSFLIGLFLVCVAPCVIFFNEFAHVRTLKKFGYAQKEIVTVSAGNAKAPSADNNGKLVHVQGNVAPEEPELRDDLFPDVLAPNALILRRTAHICQWVEEESGKKDLNGHKLYLAPKKQWLDAPAASALPHSNEVNTPGNWEALGLSSSASSTKYTSRALMDSGITVPRALLEGASSSLADMEIQDTTANNNDDAGGVVDNGVNVVDNGVNDEETSVSCLTTMVDSMHATGCGLLPVSTAVQPPPVVTAGDGTRLVCNGTSLTDCEGAETLQNTTFLHELTDVPVGTVRIDFHCLPQGDMTVVARQIGPGGEGGGGGKSADGGLLHEMTEVTNEYDGEKARSPTPAFCYSSTVLACISVQ